MSLDPVKTLSDLVAIPSVNPMGKSVSGPEYLETRVTDHLQQLLTNLDIPWRRQPVEPERDNILARIAGDPNRLLLWEVHQDTVPVEGMTIAPFGGEVREGRVYGRGACDVKGGMAAMLTAFARLHEERPAGMPTVVLACTMNEEFGYQGAAALTELWSSGKEPLLPRRPDMAIVAEPTELDVVVAHKGVLRWKCHALGRAAHTSQPHLGDNAIYKMAAVIEALHKYADRVAPSLGEHPLCGKPTVSVSTISGGISVNTVPDRVTIETDRRLLPEEDPYEAFEHLKAFITAETKLGGADIEHDPPYRDMRGLPDAANGELADSLLSAVRQVRPAAAKIGVPYGTDASVIAEAGVPVVVFGPGSIDQAHTADEWIAVEQLEQAAEILYRFGTGENAA